MNTIVVLSGGVDSTTLLYKLIKEGNQVKAISFDYGQKHKKELEYAKKTCDLLGVEHKIIDLSSLKDILKSSLTSDKEIPEGDYGNENMQQTVVPNRNMIMLSVAMGYAISEEYEAVSYAAHAGDHEIYPDCRPIFVEKISDLARVVDYEPIKIMTPFIFISKAEIVKQGIELNVPYENTWSCYKGEEEPCGKCGTCVERAEAFALNNIKDPLIK